MQSDLLRRHFEAMGSRLELRRQGRGRGFWPRVRDFRIDVARDRRGEYFDLLLGEEEVDFEILDCRPAERHLLLMATVPDDTRREGERRSRFLCGHDERHWFVAGAPRGSTVLEAMESLKPISVRLSQERRRVKTRERNQRRNAGFVRQGEWFFVPAPELRPEEWLVLRKEPLRRGGGKPHVVEFLYRRGGTTVHVCHRYPDGLTEAQYTRLLRRDRAARNLPWRTMMREPEVFARGRVRHADHRTIVLPFWHRVLVSGEVRTSNVAFLD